MRTAAETRWIADKSAQVLRLLASAHPRSMEMGIVREFVGTAGHEEALGSLRRHKLIMSDGKNRIRITDAGISKIERIDGFKLVNRKRA